MPNDLELLEAWRGGDREAGRSLFDRYFSVVQAFLRGKADDVEDAVQRVFQALLEVKDQLQVRTTFRAYVLAVARHELYAGFRRRMKDAARFEPQTQSIAALMPSPSQIIAAKAEQRLLLEGLRGIPLDHQILLELHYWDELTTAELATVLDIPRNTVKTRLRRARHLLEEHMQQIAESPELLRSTTYDLERWARSIRQHVDP